MIRRRWWMLLGGVGVTLALPLLYAAGQDAETSGQSGHRRFSWVDIYIDSGDAPLAAYQFELTAATGEFEIVGIEGGEHAAFAKPPYYDPAALHDDRVILGAFSTDDDLPAGKTRVARVHVVTADRVPLYAADSLIAADADERPVRAAVLFQQGATP